MNRRALSLLLAFTVFLAATPFTATAATSAEALERARQLETLYLQEGPSVPLSAAYRALPPEQRHVLLGRLRDMVLAQIPPEILSGQSDSPLPPELAAKLKALVALAQATTPEQLDALVLSQDLDHFMPLPAEIVRLYHDRSWTSPGPDGSTREALRQADLAAPATWRAAIAAAPGYVNDEDPAPSSLELLGEDDAVPAEEVPADEVSPDPNGLGVKVTRIVALPAHALVNSKRLARALNHLCNPTYADRPLAVTVAGRRLEATDPDALMAGLAGVDELALELYDARMFVNFVGMSMPHGDEILPVRIPTWFSTRIDATGAPLAPGAAPLIVPGNHSEHLLVLRRRGDDAPLAMVKWYMGLPSGAVRQGTLFKPAVTRRDSWCGFRIVHTYEDLATIRLFARTAVRLMRAFNFLQERYAFPKNGYAILAVCDDTTGLMEAILRHGESTVWPLVRDPRLDFYLDAVLTEEGVKLGGTEGRLAVPSDARPDLYPELAAPEAILARLGCNVPTRDPGELALPALGAALDELARNHPAFAAALERMD